MIRSNDKVLKIADLCINTLDYENKRHNVETKVKVEDEMLPLSIHIVEEIPTRAFMMRLIDEEKFQNWKTKPIPFVFKK